MTPLSLTPVTLVLVAPAKGTFIVLKVYASVVATRHVVSAMESKNFMRFSFRREASISDNSMDREALYVLLVPKIDHVAMPS